MIYQNFKSPLDLSQSFIFTHIPKCAGTSVNEFLMKTFSYGYHLYERDKNIHTEIRDPSTQNIIGAGGHFAYRQNPLCIYKPDSLHITLLRNPVERIISLYEYLLSQKNHYFLNADLNLRYEDINQFIREMAFEGNVCASFLAPGHDSSGRAIDFILKNYSIVGIVERLDLFEKSLRQFLSNFVCPAEPIQFLNITPNKSCSAQQLNPNSIDILYETNRLDMEIYSYFSND
jgi:hypothetical protein